MNEKTYETVSQATRDLQLRGYDTDLETLLDSRAQEQVDSPGQLSPDQFVIDEIHRFEGETDPGDAMIIYAISSTNGETKGLVINAFGPDADPRKSRLVAQLKRD